MFKKKQKIQEEAINKLTDVDIKQMVSHCKCYKVSEVPKNPWRIDSLPTARLIDKYSRDNNYAVLTAALQNDKSIFIRFVTAVDKEDSTTAPYEKICEHFGWDSFETSENQQTIYPKWS